MVFIHNLIKKIKELQKVRCDWMTSILEALSIFLVYLDINRKYREVIDFIDIILSTVLTQ